MGSQHAGSVWHASCPPRVPSPEPRAPAPVVSVSSFRYSVLPTLEERTHEAKHPSSVAHRGPRHHRRRARLDDDERTARAVGRGLRHGDVQGARVAQHRTRPRRPLDRRRGGRRAPARVLLRRRRRRRVEDDRRRQHVESRDRRPDSKLVGRRRRRLRVEPGRRLHRDGRGLHPRQHHAGRRHLQVRRRGQNLDAHGARRHARHLRDRRPSEKRRHRVCRGLRPSARAERRARRLSIERRRQDVAARPLPRQQDGRHRPRDGSPRSGRPVRGAVGGVSRVVPDVERRTRERPVQDDRRRRHLDRADAQARHAVGHHRPHRRRGVAGRLEARVRARRERERRPVPIGRRRGDVAEDERGSPAAPARVLLHAHLRRPEGQGHSLRVEHRLLQVHRRRQDVPDHDSRAARRQPRPVDRSERPEADHQQQRRRRHGVDQRRRDLDG